MEEQKNEIIVYQPNETVRLDVRLENDTVWLSQTQMCDLFGVVKSNVSYHLKNIFESKELEYEATVRKIRTVRFEGNRRIEREIEYFNLDVIISLGYRVNTKRGIQFRQWATRILKEYLLRGYAVNERFERLERRVARTEEQIGYFVKTSLPPMEGVLFEGQICDAHEVAVKIIKSAKKSIALIDNWVDGTVFTMLGERRKGVVARVYSRKFSEATMLALEKHNAQFAPIEYIQYSGSHDRFLIVDETTVYHIGASLKDIGSKLFAFSKMSIPAKEILERLVGSS